MKKGSITIETSIAFTILILFVSYVVNAANIYRTDIYMQRSLRKACDDMSICTPLSITSADVASTLLNSVPNSSIESENISELFNELTRSLVGLDINSNYQLSASFFDLVLSHRFESTVLSNYQEFSSSTLYTPDDINIDFDININDSIIYVEMEYSLITISGEYKRYITDVIPFYGSFSTFNNPINENEQENYDYFWSLGNFEKGRWIHEHYNSNLPYTFPVIDSFENGNAVSYTSIDLNAQTYSSENKVRERIYGEINNLANFEGANVLINGSNYNVDSSEIVNRTLYFIIPENSPSDSREILNEAAVYAASIGVNIQIVEMGNS